MIRVEGLMDDHKKKRKRELHTRINAILPHLEPLLTQMAGDAHEILAINASEQGNSYVDYDRYYWLGNACDRLSNMCGPNARILSDVITMLEDIEHKQLNSDVEEEVIPQKVN